MTFTFRPISLPADESIVHELLLLGFPELVGTPGGSREHLRWKFEESSSRGLSLIGFEGDQPVAFYGVIPLHYRIDGRRSSIGLVVDVMSHPEIRRRGLFVETGRAAMELVTKSNVEGVTGYPIRPDVMPGHIKVGWSVGFKLPVYILPTGGNAGAPAGLPRWLGAFRLFGAVYRRLTSPLRWVRGGRTTELRDVDFATSPVVAAVASDERAAGRDKRIERSVEFWRWRLAKPGADYRCGVVEVGDEAAYVVARPMLLQGIPSLAVLDVASTGRSAQRVAISFMIKLAGELQVSTIAICVNPSHARSLRLGRAGFLRSPQRFTLIHRATSDSPVDAWFEDEGTWRLSWLDSDTV